MAAVEPMLQSKPVIVHDYPSIVEAVGDAAYTLPWGCDSMEWEDAIEEVLLSPDKWCEKSKHRGEFVMNRQKSEIDGLIEFLEGL